MRPMYFGTGGELFGCHHPGSADGDVAVVLCPALLGEHVQQYRLLNRVAGSLAAIGLPVLRFDWYGTGDSAGDLDAATVTRWLDDLAAACDWICRQSRRDRLVLAGWRLGATLAGIAAGRDERVAGLALWDPVADGGTYMDELRIMHEANLAEYLPSRPDDEVLGFRLPAMIQSDLAALRLGPAAVGHVLLMGSDETSLRAAADILCPDRVTIRCHDMPAGWLAPEDGIYDVLVPLEAMRTMVDWIAELPA